MDYRWLDPGLHQRASMKIAHLAAAAITLSLSMPAHANLGDPLPGLSRDELNYFNAGLGRFTEVDSVLGTEPGAPGLGLGPRFNLNSCVGCHGFPAVGGSSSPRNPMIAVATEYGAKNTIPYFVRAEGPSIEARFKYFPDGTRDGGVHNNFVITGRKDASGCEIKQPDFIKEASTGNISFRIVTPLFGDGLIDELQDSVILANRYANESEKRALGISGHENRSANDGTISKFGWKAQNKSITIFGGEAYNVEQGVTNDLFPTERSEAPGCALNPTPEDHVNLGAALPTDAMSDVQGFTQFIRYLAPPPVITPLPASAQRGAALFSRVGCVLCHTATLMTGNTLSPALSRKPVNLYSDLLVHHMGAYLADDIIQGLAGPDEFRTAPLWGVGRRLFFLHDGRATDLITAIEDHARRPDEGKNATLRLLSVDTGGESEADDVIRNFNRLSDAEQGELIEFLKAI